MSILDDTKSKMAQAIEHLKAEFKAIRTGRANTAVLDSVTVDVFGTATKLKALAGITTPDSRSILVTPYDRSQASTIAKAIEKANLNLTPVVDGHLVRIKVPQMDQAQRGEMVKLVKRKAEEGKVSIRGIRQKANDAIKKSDHAEDERKSFEKKVQEMTDKSCKEIDELAGHKEKEVLEV